MKQEWSTVLWKVAQIGQDWTKMFPILKHEVSRIKIKFLYKMEKVNAKSDKQKIFLYTPVSKFQKISTLNICDGAKQF